MSHKHCDLGDGRDKRIKERLPIGKLFKSDHAKAVALGAGVFSLVIASCVFEPLGFILISLVFAALGLTAVWCIGWMVLELWRDMMR